MKIFVTVGSMLPFDRLISAMDAWAATHPEAEIFAQIGKTKNHPAHMPFQEMMIPAEYREQVANCDLVVTHVGMGTVITAMEWGKPLVMLPRKPDLQEVTSNHQFATAKWMEHNAGVRIVYTEQDLAQAIAESVGSEGVKMNQSGTRGQLIETLKQFIAS